ncbi:uncharacterized protein HD556DRAFT_268645 [Suillus plorans]|uniref:Casein kinase substrate phosphoprotein PP28 domain-containing protein n=1 Tax=Suillus plorans TaxID=116603 RepID=A0A9P7DKG4_9AGAM|nr:uncharacterized protein HD556DRAFT_268645 [Suillus plorans]KAG1797032.1 hypothetical protein HD556DRAFT_268645 [Suillus plorans]
MHHTQEDKMVRGTGKFKTKRGGGRNFSKHLEIDENGVAVLLDRRWAPRDREGETDSNKLKEEEEEEEEEGASGSVAQPKLSRSERKALKKKQVDQKQQQAEGESDTNANLINPNHVEKKMNISDLGAPRELTCREREAKEKQEAKHRYCKASLSHCS